MDEGEALVTRQRVQQFLDEWHFRMVQAKVAKVTGRHDALRMALDVIELNGVALPNKEAFIGGDEDALIGYIVECMPLETQQQFEHITLGLFSLLKEVTDARRALDGPGGETEVQEMCKAREGLPMMNAILRHSVTHAGKEAAWILHSNESWRSNTEARIQRLMAASLAAEEAARRLAAVEDRLRHCGPMVVDRARGSLLRMLSTRDAVTLQTFVSAWHAAMEEAREFKEARAKMERQLADLEDKLVQSKEKQMANVKAVLMRGTAEEKDVLLRQTLETWGATVQELKKEREAEKQMEAMQAKLAEGQEAQAANAKKVLARMTGNNDQELKVQTFQAWLQFAETAQEERKREKELQEAQEKVQKQLEGQKAGQKSVLANMSASTTTGLLSMVVQNWSLQVQEERKARELERAMKASSMKLQLLSQSQLDSAHGVQERISEAIDSFAMLRCFSKWSTSVMAEAIQRSMQKKIESKKKQLNGVQTLFMTFARQLETGLDDGEISSREEQYKQDVGVQRLPHIQSGTHHAPKKGGLSKMKGMHGSTSLPDIHQHRGHPVR